MKKLKSFSVIAVIALLFLVVFSPVQIKAELEEKHIGFVLNVENEEEWKLELNQVAEELNKKVEEIVSDFSKKELKQIRIFKFSWEIISQGEKFEKKPSMVYEFQHLENNEALIVKQEKEKIIFIFKQEDKDQLINFLRTVYLPVELGISEYLK